MRLAAAAALIAVALTLVGSAGAASKWAWSESQAEAMLTSKLRLPCASVRPAYDCNSAVAQQEIAAAKQEGVDKCNALRDRWGDERADACEAYYADLPPSYFDSTLDRIRDGFSIATADCVGTRALTVGSLRFSQLRCKLTVKDETADARRLTWARQVMVVVTGKATFRWKLAR